MITIRKTTPWLVIRLAVSHPQSHIPALFLSFPECGCNYGCGLDLWPRSNKRTILKGNDDRRTARSDKRDSRGPSHLVFSLSRVSRGASGIDSPYARALLPRVSCRHLKLPRVLRQSCVLDSARMSFWICYFLVMNIQRRRLTSLTMGDSQ